MRPCSRATPQLRTRPQMKASAPMPTARITLPSVHEVGATANRPLPSELKSRAGKDGAFLHDHSSDCLSEDGTGRGRWLSTRDRLRRRYASQLRGNLAGPSRPSSTHNSPSVRPRCTARAMQCLALTGTCRAHAQFECTRRVTSRPCRTPDSAQARRADDRTHGTRRGARGGAQSIQRAKQRGRRRAPPLPAK